MFAPLLQKHAAKSPTLLRAVSWALCVSGVKVKTKYVFLTSFSVPVLYGLFWHLARYLNWGLSTDFNIPGFFFLTLAMPWTLLAIEAGELAKSIFGIGSRNVVTILMAGLGFALNVTFVKICVCWLLNKYRESTT